MLLADTGPIRNYPSGDKWKKSSTFVPKYKTDYEQKKKAVTHS